MTTLNKASERDLLPCDKQATLPEILSILKVIQPKVLFWDLASHERRIKQGHKSWQIRFQWVSFGTVSAVKFF